MAKTQRTTQDETERAALIRNWIDNYADVQAARHVEQQVVTGMLAEAHREFGDDLRTDYVKRLFYMAYGDAVRRECDAKLSWALQRERQEARRAASRPDDLPAERDED